MITTNLVLSSDNNDQLHYLPDTYNLKANKMWSPSSYGDQGEECDHLPERSSQGFLMWSQKAFTCWLPLSGCVTLRWQMEGSSSSC